MRTTAKPVKPPYSPYRWHDYFVWKPWGARIEFPIIGVPDQKMHVRVWFEWVKRICDDGEWKYQFPEAE